MTLKVGHDYKVWRGGRVQLIRIVRIQLSDDGRSRVVIKVAWDFPNWLRWCRWWLAFVDNHAGEYLVSQIEEAKSWEKLTEVESKKWRDSDGVEVRYR